MQENKDEGVAFGRVTLSGKTLPTVWVRRSAFVEGWLSAMCPDPAWRTIVEEWLANSLDLVKPMRPLFLSGPPATGKTLLVDQLSQVWGSNAVPVSCICSTFNGDMLESPILVSEDWRVDARNADHLRVIRNAIVSYAHEVRRQYKYPLEVLGFYRLIATSNEDFASLGSFLPDNPSPRYINVYEDAALYLDAAGPARIQKMVEDGEFVAHVFHLALKHGVATGQVKN